MSGREGRRVKGSKSGKPDEIGGYHMYGQVQIRIQIVGARIYQAVIPKVLKISD